MGRIKHGGRSCLLGARPERIITQDGLLIQDSEVRRDGLLQLTRMRAYAKCKRLGIVDPLTIQAIVTDAQTESWLLLNTLDEHAVYEFPHPRAGELKHTDRWIASIAVKRAVGEHIRPDCGTQAIPPDTACPRAGQAALAMELAEVIGKLATRPQMIALALLNGGSYRHAAALAGCSTQTVFADVQRMAVSFA